MSGAVIHAPQRLKGTKRARDCPVDEKVIPRNAGTDLNIHGLFALEAHALGRIFEEIA